MTIEYSPHPDQPLSNCSVLTRLYMEGYATGKANALHDAAMGYLNSARESLEVAKAARERADENVKYWEAEVNRLLAQVYEEEKQ